jgi:hypothetical protein
MPATGLSRLTTDLNIQDYLSLGYLYLLAIGIGSETLYYGLLGVNVLGYSDVLDVLLSPLAQLENEPALFATIFVTSLGMLLNIAYLRKRHARRSATDAAYQERLGAERIAETTRRLAFMQSLAPAIVIFAGYIGYSGGAGVNLAKRMAEGAMRTDHTLTFTDGEQINARLIGSNSGYIFYVPEKGTRVAISPIKETIRRIERLAETP